MPESTYDRKRRFDETPEPPGSVSRPDVDPLVAPTGDRFVIHQHYATRLHHDLRLEMDSGGTPVLVSWAVPKGLPLCKGERHLAIRTEDHPFEYITFTGTIPGGSYGAGEVRIFDHGAYEMLDRNERRLRIRLDGNRLRGVWHLVQTRPAGGKEQWLALLSDDLRPPGDPRPPAEPMLATLIDEPFDDPRWSFEPKWDGIRVIAVCDDATRLFSRNGNDVTAAYPELARLHERLVAIDAMVDGEVVAFDGGVPSFQKLQTRMHVRDPARIERLAESTPVTLLVFDVLYEDGRNLTSRPLSERRERLEELVVRSERVELSTAVVGDGTALFAAARAEGLEGIVAKRLSSPYELGRRSNSWLKVKVVLDADVVVVGWTAGEGRREGTFGSLVVAVYDGDELRYVGNVGTGYDEATLEETIRRLRSLGETEPPFPEPVIRLKTDLRRAHWVPPVLVARVAYNQLTSAGRLRAPVFSGLRDDKDPKDCTFDQFTVAAPPVEE